MPPPVDFHELLKIAEQKQHEPIVYEPKIKKPQEPEVLMTKKQKLEHEKMQEMKRQRELRLQNLENGEKSSHGAEEKKSIPKIPKLNHSTSDQKTTTSHKKVNGQDDKSNTSKNIPRNVDRNERNPNQNKSKDSIEKHQKLKLLSDRKVPSHSSADKKPKVDDETSRLIKERDEALRLLKEKERLIREKEEAVRILKEKEQLIKERDEVYRKLKLLEQSEALKSGAKSNTKSADSSVSKSGILNKKLASDKVISKNSESLKSGSSKTDSTVDSKSNSVTNKTATVSKGNLKPGTKPGLDRSEVREFPPRDLKPVAKPQNAARKNFSTSKQFPPAEVRRKMLALKRRKNKFFSLIALN